MRKIRMIVLILTWSLTFCACNVEITQEETLSADSVSTTEADGGEDSVSDENGTTANEVEGMTESVADPIKVPTKVPTKAPTKVTTKVPTKVPTKAPTKVPTKTPTKAPAKANTNPVDVMQSPETSIQNQQNMLTIPVDGVTVPGLDAGSLYPEGLIPQAIPALPQAAPAADTNPTVNYSAETPVPDSNVQYSTGDEGSSDGGDSSGSSGNTSSSASDSTSSDIIAVFE